MAEDFHRIACSCRMAVASREHEIHPDTVALFYAAHEGDDHEVTETFRG